jgi:hypothetical protein
MANLAASNSSSALLVSYSNFPSDSSPYFLLAYSSSPTFSPLSSKVSIGYFAFLSSSSSGVSSPKSGSD